MEVLNFAVQMQI